MMALENWLNRIISINQFVATALAEKMSALTTETYLIERAKRGSKQKFEHALFKIKDIESDENGKNKERPQLKAMLNLRAGDRINVHELSRLARNTKDLLSIVEAILYKESSIYFHKENLRFTPQTEADPFQKLMLTMLGAISTFERDLMLERQREGIAIAKAKGKYKGKQSRFSAEEIADIKEQFSASKNKAKLAKALGISRPYLYKLVF